MPEAPKDAIKTYVSDVVTKAWVRPARQDGTCFYCWQPVSARHKKDCPALKRWVVIDYSVQIVEPWPENMSEEQITLRLENGAWCADNLIAYMERVKKASPDGCLCAFVQPKCLGNAPLEMLERQGVERIMPDGE